MAQQDITLDHVALERWLGDRLGESHPLSATRMGQDTGVGNALFDVRWGDRRFVLRRPPVVKVTASAGNTMREARVLGALADTDVPHPRLVATCEDPAVIGSPFLMMEHVDGFTATDPLPGSVAQEPQAKQALGSGIVDGLAKLALVDWRGTGLEGFGKPDGFLARQVDRWLWQLETYRTRDISHMDELVTWLRSELPEPGPIGIVHGDYSMFNVMFTFDTPPRLAAIVDWDTSTIGEVLMDLGHLLARWDEPGEEPTNMGSRDIADRSHMLTRAELAARYERETGFDLSEIRYYAVLSLFKLGCIMEGHHANAIKAAADGEAFEDRFTNSAPGMFADALRIVEGHRHMP